MFGGLISILIAIWIYRTAIEAKTGNMVYWVIGSVVVFLSLQFLMTFFNAMLVGNDLGGRFFGIMLEVLPLAVPFLAIAVIRQVLMLKQSFSFKGLFSGIKEMFLSIINGFRTT